MISTWVLPGAITNEAVCTIILRAALVTAGTVLIPTVCVVTKALRDAMVCVLIELITNGAFEIVVLQKVRAEPEEAPRPNDIPVAPTFDDPTQFILLAPDATPAAAAIDDVGAFAMLAPDAEPSEAEAAVAEADAVPATEPTEVAVDKPPP